MKKSYKLKDDNYIDSSSVIHKKRTLKEILECQRITPTLYNSVELRDNSSVYKIGKLVIVNVCLVNNSLVLDNGVNILGLPKPVEDTIILGTYARGDNGELGSCRFKIKASDGIMSVFYPSSGTYLSYANQPRIFSFTYLTND